MVSEVINIEHNNSNAQVIGAIEFAAFKHRLQKRKGALCIPYINHPIEVAGLLVRQIHNPSVELLLAAILHDTLEDTDTTFDEITLKFGKHVAEIVLEVTDDMSLPSPIRKQLQVEKASSLSYEARCVKIADKACNIRDMLHTRMLWSRGRKVRYVRWALEVVGKMKGTEANLENDFIQTVREAEAMLKTKIL